MVKSGLYVNVNGIADTSAGSVSRGYTAEELLEMSESLLTIPSYAMTTGGVLKAITEYADPSPLGKKYAKLIKRLNERHQKESLELGKKHLAEHAKLKAWYEKEKSDSIS